MKIVAAVVFTLITSHSFAQDTPPQIDGTKYCDAVTGLFKSNTDVQKMMGDGCLKNEADYTEKLKRVWKKVPPADRDSCQTLLATAQPSNQGLAGCLALAMSKHFLDGDMPGCQ